MDNARTPYDAPQSTTGGSDAGDGGSPPPVPAEECRTGGPSTGVNGTSGLGGRSADELEGPGRSERLQYPEDEDREGHGP